MLTGEDKGKCGRVLSVDCRANKVLVEGVNRVYKHMKPSRRNQQGGRLSKEMPMNASNVALICPQTGKPTRKSACVTWPTAAKERFSSGRNFDGPREQGTRGVCDKVGPACRAGLVAAARTTFRTVH